MIAEFFDRQDDQNPVNGRIVSEDEQLLQIMDSLAEKPPFFCELVCENGYNLLMGIGGPLGCAQFSRNDGSIPYLMATTSDAKLRNEGIEFLIGNTPTPVLARYCLPICQIRQIAIHFRNTGSRSPAVDWEEI